MEDMTLYKVRGNYFINKKKAHQMVLGWKHTLRGYVSDTEIIDSYVKKVKLSDIIVDFPKKTN